MKTGIIISALLVAICVPLPVRAAEHDIVFTGVLVLKDKTMIAIADMGAGTRWVEVGGNVNGYKIKGYDPEAEVVMLTTGGEEIRVPLKSARVESAGSGISSLSIEARRSLWLRVKDLEGAAFLAAVAEQIELPEAILKKVRELKRVQEFVDTEPAKLDGYRARVAESQKNYDRAVATENDPRVRQQSLAHLKADQARYNATLECLEKYPKIVSGGVLDIKMALSASL